jgi:hypothetical protein
VGEPEDGGEAANVDRPPGLCVSQMCQVIRISSAPSLHNRVAPMRLIAWDILSHPDCDTCLLTAGHGRTQSAA